VGFSAPACGDDARAEVSQGGERGRGQFDPVDVATGTQVFDAAQ
jgi:hypothetical protein